MSHRFFAPLAICSVMLCAVSGSLQAQEEGPATLRTIVRAERKGDASVSSLQPSDLQVEFNGRKVDVTRVQPLIRKSAATPVEVAVLIDDSLRGNFGTQLDDLQKFVSMTASPGVSLGIGYMQNGRVIFPAGFSTEPEQEMKAVRLPLSTAGISGSPYFCLQDLVKHWPTNTGAQHVVLMITNGIDYYNGSVSPLNQDSPYVTSAVSDAQRAGVPVYSIYYGRREFSATLPSFSGQSYLSQVAEGTGGQLYNGGQINPVSLTPYFSEFSRDLRESYVVSFQTTSRKPERLRVKTNLDGVKLHASQVVQVRDSSPS